MKKRNSIKKLSLALFIIILSFLLISCGKKDKTLDESVDANSQEELDTKGKFAPGLKVFGVEIGGLNANEASVELANAVQNYSNNQNITINIPGQPSINLSAYDLGIGIDVTKTLNNALMLSSDDFVVSQIKSTGFYEAPILHTIDSTKLRSALNEQAESFPTQVVEPTVNFSPDNPGDKFTFTDGVSGVTVDVDALYNSIEQAANSGISPIAVTAAVTEVPPTQNIADLQQNISQIVTFSTVYTGSEDRIHNLVLGSSKINNITLNPGETFSFNDRVGPRDQASGWKEAATIVGGSRYENDYGGGICQTSTTLYNAVLKSDLEIVTRNKHSIPSNYIEHGLDATVSYGLYDFVFRNNTNYPVYIFSHVAKNEQKVYVTIYGRPLPDGEKIILRSKELSSVDPGTPELMEDETMGAGQSAWEVQARRGFTVQSYKEYVKDGVVLRTENLTTDTYKAVNGVKRVGKGGGGSPNVSIPSDDDFQVFGNDDGGTTDNSGGEQPFDDLPQVDDNDTGDDTDTGGAIDLPLLGDDDDGEIPFE